MTSVDISGNLLYTPLRLQETEFQVRTRRDEDVRIGLVLTQEVAQGSDQFIQVANIIMNELVTVISQLKFDFT